MRRWEAEAKWKGQLLGTCVPMGPSGECGGRRGLGLHGRWREPGRSRDQPMPSRLSAPCAAGGDVGGEKACAVHCQTPMWRSGSWSVAWTCWELLMGSWKLRLCDVNLAWR